MIFLLSSLYGGEQFVFTARTVSKNHIVTYDNLSLSPLMRQRDRLLDFSCDLMIKPSKRVDTYSFLLEHIDLIAECFLGENVRVYDYGEESFYLANYQTDTAVLPVYFTVDFKEDFVTLILLGR